MYIALGHADSESMLVDAEFPSPARLSPYFMEIPNPLEVVFLF